MRPLALFFSLIFFLLIRYWYISVPLMMAAYVSDHDEAKHDRMQFRGCDPQDFTDEQIQQFVHIMVPAYVKDPEGEYPVTIANNASRSFEGTFYVLCTATETVLDGTTNWVLGVKQYPYLLDRNMQIGSRSIATEQFRQVTDDMGPYTNLTKCKLYTDVGTANSTKDAIETKWVQVTLRGAARAVEIGYTEPVRNFVCEASLTQRSAYAEQDQEVVCQGV